MTDKVLKKIEGTIDKYGLLEKNDRVLVALSGGADSVFLLNILLVLREKYNLHVFAAHVNHLLRGKDADEDENFCKKLCKEKGVPLFVKRENVALLAKEQSVSDEVAGRMVRYGFFYEIKEKEKINKIATAHNADDNAETSLYRFIRGSGVRGLAGIPYKNGDIIRPVLDVTRKEIEEFLKENNFSFVTDKTNFEEIYTRNILRLSLIPKIEKEINRGFKKSLLSNISLYNECADFLEECTENTFSGCARFNGKFVEIDRDKLLGNHSFIQKSVLKKAINALGSEDTSENVGFCITVLENKKSSVNISGNITVESKYGKLYFYKEKAKPFIYENVSEYVEIKETGAVITFSDCEKIEKNAGKNVFFADKNKLCNIMVRSKKDGDFFYPSGRKNQKVKLKDFFINNKIPSFLRNEIPIVCSGDDVVWIAGFRRDKRFEANENTTNILKMEIICGGD